MYHCNAHFQGAANEGFSGWFTPRYDFIDHRRSLGTGAVSFPLDKRLPQPSFSLSSLTFLLITLVYLAGQVHHHLN